jgi:hypothetical protein
LSADPSAKKNAIERRLQDLEASWNDFAENDQARLLRWVVDGDSARMVDLFLELQNEEASQIPDLFIRFNEPFEEDADRYGRALRESLVEQYQEIREGLAAEGLPDQWQCPQPRDDESSQLSFVRASASLRKYYEDIMVHLVAVLTPQQVASAGAWRQWLADLARTDTPPNVRFLVVDRAEAPLLDDLASDCPDSVVTTVLDLDMPGAYAELVRDVPGTGPGFTFRKLFIAITTAASSGNLGAARQAAERALKIASEQNWPQMQTVVHMALGAAHFAAGDLAATLRCYRSANQAIAGTDDPAAGKLNIQTRFAEAAALVADQDYVQAADVYGAIAPLAAEQQDHFALLESRRMEAYCRQQAGQFRQAWEAGQQALEAGDLMDDEARGSSTLPYVGQALLQLIEQGHVAESADDVRTRMTDLVGDDWQQKLAEQTVTTS